MNRKLTKHLNRYVWFNAGRTFALAILAICLIGAFPKIPLEKVPHDVWIASCWIFGIIFLLCGLEAETRHRRLRLKLKQHNL